MSHSIQHRHIRLALASAALVVAALVALPALAYAAGAWSPQDSGITDGSSLSSVSFVDSLHGWAVGVNGEVVHTSNGGTTWSLQDSGIDDGTMLSAVCFVDATHGWAVGADGTIVHTTNGGTTWTFQDSGIDNGDGFYAVDFTDTTHGWAVGDEGMILHTTNGGTTWTAQNSGVGDDSGLNAVTFTDSTHGWAVGDNATIVRTTNGGTTWTAQDSGIGDGGGLYGVAFTDASHGWVVDGDGTIIATTNGGAKWTAQDSNIQDGSGLYGITFSDSSHGWAVGDNGTVVVTVNGGATWTLQDSGVDNGDGLYAVTFTDSTHGWAVGDEGTIIASDGSGPAPVQPVPDVTAPTTAIITSPSAHSGWNTTSVNVELDAADEFGGSGVASTYFTLDNQPQATYGVPFAVSGEGTHTVTYHSVDASGNIESAKAATIKIDGTAPHTTATAPTGWQTGAVSVTLSASDARSGVATTYYRINGGAQTAYTAPIAILAQGTTTVSYWSVDVAGNAETPQSVTVLADNKAPVTTVHYATAPNAAGWSNTDAVVTLAAVDVPGGSGLAGTYYTLDGGPTQSFATPLMFTEGTHVVGYWSTDVAANTEAPRTATIKVDETAPLLSIDATASYLSSATIQATGSDALSGLDRIEMRVDGAAWTRATSLLTSTPGTHTLDARAFDVAGNETDVSSTFVVTWPETVATKTSIKAPTSVKVKKSLKITGVVSPLGAPGKVTITVTHLIGKKWKSAGSVTVSVVKGAFSHTFKETKKGSWRFVAKFSGGVVGATTCTASKSLTKTVKVK